MPINTTVLIILLAIHGALLAVQQSNLLPADVSAWLGVALMFPPWIAAALRWQRGGKVIMNGIYSD